MVSFEYFIVLIYGVFFESFFMLFFIILLTAIGDEFNASKSGELQLFHTKVKPFNVLHPNGIFASNPEYLNIDGMDIVNIPGIEILYF